MLVRYLSILYKTFSLHSSLSVSQFSFLTFTRRQVSELYVRTYTVNTNFSWGRVIFAIHYSTMFTENTPSHSYPPDFFIVDLLVLILCSRYVNSFIVPSVSFKTITCRLTKGSIHIIFVFFTFTLKPTSLWSSFVIFPKFPPNWLIGLCLLRI